MEKTILIDNLITALKTSRDKYGNVPVYIAAADSDHAINSIAEVRNIQLQNPNNGISMNAVMITDFELVDG